MVEDGEGGRGPYLTQGCQTRNIFKTRLKKNNLRLFPCVRLNKNIWILILIYNLYKIKISSGNPSLPDERVLCVSVALFFTHHRRLVRLTWSRRNGIISNTGSGSNSWSYFPLNMFIILCKNNYLEQILWCKNKYRECWII